MTLYSDLEKDMLASANAGSIQVPQVIELLCNLIDLRLESIEHNLNFDSNFGQQEFKKD